MNEVTTIAPVRKSVTVKAPIAHAFDVFTSELNSKIAGVCIER